MPRQAATFVPSLAHHDSLRCCNPTDRATARQGRNRTVSRRKRRPPSLAAIELADYFLSADAAHGMRSSWGALTDFALGGFGGVPDPERGISDRRFGWERRENDGSYHGEGDVSRLRDIRHALRRLPARDPGDPTHADILHAAHGSLPVKDMLDRGLGKGTAYRCSKFIPPYLLPIALLTPTVIRSWATEKDRLAAPIAEGTLVHVRHKGGKVIGAEECETYESTGEATTESVSTGGFFVGRTVDAYRTGRKERVAPKHPAEHTAAGWLAALCTKADLTSLTDPKRKKKPSRAERQRRETAAKEARTILGKIKGEAIRLLAEAEGAYRIARGWGPEKADPDLRAQRKAQRRAERPEPVLPTFASEWR